jgi:hypothetical protein
MFQNLHFRLISVDQIQLFKKSFLLFFLFSFLGNLTFAQVPGNILNFDGTNDYVNLGKTTSFTNTSFAIGAYVCRKTGSGGMVVSKNNSGVVGQYFLKLNTGKMISFSREVVPW